MDKLQLLNDHPLPFAKVLGLKFVAASDTTDSRAGFSNFGACVDLFAPGVDIEIGMEDGLVKVVSPIEGSPAYRAGLKPNDLITKIDDTAVKGLTMDQRFQYVLAGVNYLKFGSPNPFSYGRPGGNTDLAAYGAMFAALCVGPFLGWKRAAIRVRIVSRARCLACWRNILTALSARSRMICSTSLPT